MVSLAFGRPNARKHVHSPASGFIKLVDCSAESICQILLLTQAIPSSQWLFDDTRMSGCFSGVSASYTWICESPVHLFRSANIRRTKLSFSSSMIRSTVSEPQILVTPSFRTLRRTSLEPIRAQLSLDVASFEARQLAAIFFKLPGYVKSIGGKGCIV